MLVERSARPVQLVGDLYFVRYGVERLHGRVFLFFSTAAVSDEFEESDRRNDQRWNARQNEDDRVNPARIRLRLQRGETLLETIIN